MTEKLIKSKKRVQKHGEVFTPSWMVQKMLDTPGVKEACEDLEATFLEPSAGDGNFLVAILTRKLEMVIEKYSNSLVQFENFSLYALSTLYGIELLEDNAQMCVMNLYEVYLETYSNIAYEFNTKTKKSVLSSAKTIIKANIAQGNFLTRRTDKNEPIIFSEWQMIGKTNSKAISIIRTEYSLDDIFGSQKNEAGTLSRPPVQEVQLSFFDDLVSEGEETKSEEYKYVKVKITEIYKEEMVCYEK